MSQFDPFMILPAGLAIAAIFWQARREAQRKRQRAVPDDPLTPLGYERHCAAILTSQGWRTTLTAGSGDQGVDVLAKRHGRSVVIQCKLYSRPVGNAAVQEAIAGQRFMGATHAAVVSNQSYTRAAQELAHRTGVRLLSADDLRRADALFK